MFRDPKVSFCAPVFGPKWDVFTCQVEKKVFLVENFNSLAVLKCRHHLWRPADFNFLHKNPSRGGSEVGPTHSIYIYICIYLYWCSMCTCTCSVYNVVYVHIHHYVVYTYTIPSLQVEIFHISPKRCPSKFLSGWILSFHSECGAPSER